MDGDGRSDIAVSEDNVFTWYPSAGIDGYGGPRMAPKPFDEERGPALVFSDPTSSIFLASMSGSGLTDIVRIRNGEVCYWPNLGYGRFGAKVSMDFCPVFDTPDLFNPDYIHLADVNGTGATDILYLGKNKFRAWLNQSGNRWSEEADIAPFPTTELPSRLSVGDFLGNGTACVIWSSPLPRYATTPLQYVDLMGGKKPYLLTGYKNQAGKEVTLEYKSSTHFYLADKLAGNPWVTKLPFPVHCLTKVSSRDTVTRAYLTTEYAYHHGYYDHAEREYRGFGRVEQTDTETFDEFVKSGASNVVNQPLHQAPVLTKTWFHTGAYFGEGDIIARFRSEFFQNPDFAEYHLPAPSVPGSLSAQEMREAQRACKGMTIRQEVYGLDNIAGVSTVPYSATERNCLIQRVQPLGANRYAVFLVTEGESISYSYERNSKDPHIGHTLNTAIDVYGNILESANVAYPRQPGAAGLPARVQAEQQKRQITYGVTGYTNDSIASAAYRLRLRCETRSFELTGVAPAATYFTLDEIHTAFAGATPIEYEDAPNGTSQKRALKHARTLFLKDDLSGPLALGQMQFLGLVHETYRLTFTASLLTALYGTRVTPAFVTEGAYVHSNDFKAIGLFPPSDANDEWWVHAGHATYPAGPANLFYLPNGFLDPFANLTSIAYYADYQLLVQAVTDAAGNATSVETFNFRNLSPQLIQDANANLSEARFDILGFVVGTAVKGKGNDADDFTGFVTDLTPVAVATFFGDPLTNGPTLLQHATSRFVYDFSVVPFRVASIVRETHFQATLTSGIPSKLQYRFEYSDGFGNVAMRKIQAEPGIALALDGSNNVIQVDTTPNPRWVGNGRTVLNNKGKPVKQFEPYFSATYNYEDDPQLVEIGVTPVLYYDPPGRNVRTEYPNGTFSKTEIQGWLTKTFDQNDTVSDSDWFTQRTTGSLAANPQENQAALKAAVHYNTPTVSHSDCLGRSFYAIRHNKFVDHTTLLLTELFYETYTQLDIEGNARQIVDPRGNTVVSNDYDMLGNQAHSLSMDAGDRWLLNDCTGQALYAFDSKSQIFHTLYDAIRRPVQSTVAKGAPPIMFDQITYGEGQAGDQARNLRGRIFEHRDQAGVLTNISFDFKGNLLESTRVLTIGYQNDVDWKAPPPLNLLEVFTTQSEFDALNRPIRIVAPNSTLATANILTPTYNEANLLETVSAQLRGAAATTPFVTNADYNEKGQRTRIDYANGASTIYKYDPDTFRLIGLVTARNTDPEPFWEDKSKITLPAFAGDVLQYLTYTFDPVGNITYIKDDAQQTIYFNNRTDRAEFRLHIRCRLLAGAVPRPRAYRRPDHSRPQRRPADGQRPAGRRDPVADVHAAIRLRPGRQHAPDEEPDELEHGICVSSDEQSTADGRARRRHRHSLQLSVRRARQHDRDAAPDDDGLGFQGPATSYCGFRFGLHQPGILVRVRRGWPARAQSGQEGQLDRRAPLLGQHRDLPANAQWSARAGARDAARDRRHAPDRDDRYADGQTWRQQGNAAHPVSILESSRDGVPGTGRRRADHFVRGILRLRQHFIPGHGPKPRDSRQALSVHGQGEGRGNRIHLSRRPVLRSVAGEVDAAAIRKESLAASTFMGMRIRTLSSFVIQRGEIRQNRNLKRTTKRKTKSRHSHRSKTRERPNLLDYRVTLTWARSRPNLTPKSLGRPLKTRMLTTPCKSPPSKHTFGYELLRRRNKVY